MSTMHTNSALQAMSRLIDFGVKPLRRISLIDGKGVEVIDGLGAQVRISDLSEAVAEVNYFSVRGVRDG